LDTCKKLVNNYESLSKINVLASTGSFIKSHESKNILDNIKLMLIGVFSSVDFTYTALNMLFLVMILTTFVEIIMKFNILSIIYIWVVLLVWYSTISILQFIPKTKVTIKVNDNKKPFYSNVYLIDNFSGEYVIVLDEKEGPINIMKTSIISITPENNSKVLQDLQKVDKIEKARMLMKNLGIKRRVEKKQLDLDKDEEKKK
jgi:hypothetical protein